MKLRASTAFLVLTFFFLSACGTETPDAAPETMDTPEEEVSSLRSPSAEGARAFIVSPADGATVSSPVTVVFGIENMEVSPAGEDKPNSGHHHLMVDVEELPDFNMPLPADANHIHFGLGQTETELELEPGTHTLQLVLGNYIHMPHNPAVVSETITITVE